MNIESGNPYQTPISELGTARNFDPRLDLLASRWSRLLAMIIDTAVIIFAFIPLAIFFGWWESEEFVLAEELMFSFMSVSCFLAINFQLLTSRGQTVGKFLLGIQIVDYETGHVPGILRTFFIRICWSLPIENALMILIAQDAEYVTTPLLILDPILIFGQERRCLHDYFAGTKVLVYQENRPLLNEDSN